MSRREGAARGRTIGYGRTKVKANKGIREVAALPAQTRLRARMYVVIDALESDLRRLLREYVLPYNDVSTALGGFEKKARERAVDDAVGANDVDLVDYLDLGDEVSLLNRHRAFLTDDDASALRICNPSLQQLIPIRNRVMHGRPLATADPDDFNSAAATIATSGLTALRLRDVHNRLNADPDWHPVAHLEATLADKVLHTLPPPDYDETGLLGRQREIARLKKLLLRTDRDPVITLVGQGGVGKTALAVEALYELVNDADCPYEAVLWTSLKTEELTGEGVRQISSTVTSVLELPQDLVDQLDERGEATWEWVGEALAGVPTLLVIDNVESADANEIIDIYDSLPGTTSLLLTSRVGLGQLERRVEVGPLSDSDGEKLLRLYARRRGADHWASLDASRVARVSRRLRNVPLALKWYVMALEAGAQPEDVLEDQSDLLSYCVDSVVNSLPDNAMLVADALFAIGAPTPFGELSILLDFTPDALRDSIHTLQRSALVEVEQAAGNAIGNVYGLSETFNHYIRSIRPPDESLVADVRSRADELRKAEERRRQHVNARSLDPGSVHCRGESDRAAAFLLGKAIRSTFRHNTEEALDLIDQASELGRSYFEVPRVRGFVLAKSGRIAEATQAYAEALELAETDGDDAVVAYYFGGHLLRGEGDVERGLALLVRAHDELGTPETAVELARGMTFAGRYDEAHVLLESALESASGKTEVIALSASVDLNKRTAERFRDERSPREGLHSAVDGAQAGLRAILDGTLDLRLSDTVMRCLTEGSRCAVDLFQTGVASESDELRLAELLKDTTGVSQSWRASRDWSHLQRQLDRLGAIDSLAEPLRDSVRLLLGDANATNERGSVKFYDHSKGFGFLVCEADADELFFHQSDLRSEDDVPWLVQATTVTFTRDQDENGRTCARGVTLDPIVDRDAIGRNRYGRVLENGLKERYAFIEDQATHCAVFVHRGSLKAGTGWADLKAGGRVTFDVEIGQRGPIATDGSVAVVPSQP